MISTLRRTREIGRKADLRYVHGGTQPGEATTLCHVRNRLLVDRSGLRVVENHVTPKGNRPDCNTPVYGIGMVSRGAC